MADSHSLSLYTLTLRVVNVIREAANITSDAPANLARAGTVDSTLPGLPTAPMRGLRVVCFFAL